MIFERDGRHIHADLLGPRGGRTVCLVHSLAADMTMWAEQVPALLGAGDGQAARAHAQQGLRLFQGLPAYR
jgi:hypothetical protein